MKKTILIISILYSFIFSVGEAGAIFLLISPSPTMNGYGGSGVSSINYDAFSSYYNPAHSLINEGIPGLFDGFPGINDAREKFKGGDFIIDIRTGYQINKNIRLGLIINNLLNREYMSRPANMMPQRTFAMQRSMKI